MASSSSPARLFRGLMPLRRNSSSRPSSSESAHSPRTMASSPSSNSSPSTYFPLSQSPLPSWSSRDRSSSTTSTMSTSSIRALSIAHLEEERRAFPSELGILEPRPVVYWESMESRVSAEAWQE